MPGQPRVALTIALLGGLAAGTATGAGSAHPPDHGPAERARVVLTHALPKLDGNHLATTLVEVTYGPGEASPPHTHPCAVVGYVVSGTLRTRIEGQPEAVYTAGQSFYEPPGAVHQISANASSIAGATFIAVFTCDRPAELSQPPAGPKPGGGR